jgi:hypothetical protein
MATVPLFATANLLLSFCPHEKAWWECLDQIWDAAETADGTSPTVLPRSTRRCSASRTTCGQPDRLTRHHRDLVSPATASGPTA